MNKPTPGIYVEILIRAPMDELWKHTQNPELHERWDLRFTSIKYLPRESEAVPQQFLYATRIGFGMEIRGKGESTGSRDLPNGERLSSLKFNSDDPRSLIREGSGYWKYIPTDQGIRFLTWYDYRTRFGIAGKIADTLAFRPLMGWATAWSFDRLRLAIEAGVDPATAMIHSLTHAISRLSVAAVFLYHGLVPKILHRDSDELAMLRDAGITVGNLPEAITALGIAEMAFALILMVFWNKRLPALLSVILMAFATAGVALNSPRYFGAAFNPLSLNLCVAALALIDWLSLRYSPSASRCLRLPPKGRV